ncbi:hypothetical protein [Paracidovorax wautersii]|uniref:Uncharacterized protein n=1 Tax=Paracidovorax wautersii TaxID=1177982 RepID=A0A1I2FI81_9BURK|nr:hypothetical protein [Paracidovorax wautersii]SFF05194.1 hypothetical protein SAMN04489711_1119 [Paracidovorax wautersii]
MGYKTTYKGIEIEITTYPHPDMPGYWFPHAQMRNPRTGIEEPVALRPQRGSKQEADALVLEEAAERIRFGNNGLGLLPGE